MSSPEPAFPQYRDTPGGGPERDYELTDYYDTNGLPPPHRLSGIHDSAYPGFATPNHSAYSLRTPSPQNPFLSSADTTSRGQYVSAATSEGGMAHQAPAGGYSAFDNSVGTSGWLQQQVNKDKRSRYLLIGTLVTVVGLVIVGIAVGVALGTKHKSSSSSTSSSSSSNPVTQTDPNDPSTFVKDSRLKQSFYGLAYTPEGSQLPNCGNNLTSVITDIQLMSQLTTRLRLYGADCNQSALVLEAIKQTKVNMTVYLGNYPIATDNNAAYDRQRDELTQAIQTYGTTHISGLTVGNEFMLDYLDDNGATDPNSDVGNQGATILIADIQDTNTTLQGLSLPTVIPVGTADAGSYFNTEVLEAVNYGMSNVHPWFANVSIDDAAGWTWDFFETNNVQPAQALSNQPQMYIAETGWPTQSLDAGNESNGPSVASEANLQTFLNNFICQANSNGTGYFYFEMFDEPWKAAQFGGVEPYWGMFYSNKTMKNIQIPDCPLS